MLKAAAAAVEVAAGAVLAEAVEAVALVAAEEVAEAVEAVALAVAEEETVVLAAAEVAAAGEDLVEVEEGLAAGATLAVEDHSVADSRVAENRVAVKSAEGMPAAVLPGVRDLAVPRVDILGFRVDSLGMALAAPRCARSAVVPVGSVAPVLTAVLGDLAPVFITLTDLGTTEIGLVPGGDIPGTWDPSAGFPSVS